MKTLILYSSYYKNNTEKIARILASKINCDLINIKDFTNHNMENYDLIGFGSGVYKEDLSPKIYRLVEEVNLGGKDVFVFSTSGVGLKFYNKRLINLLESKGAINKGSFACKGYFKAKEFTDVKIFDIFGKLSQGHPNAKDLKMAERFMEDLIKSLTNK